MGWDRSSRGGGGGGGGGRAYFSLAMFRIPIHLHKQFCMYGFLGRAAASSGGRRMLQNHILDASTKAQHRGGGLEIEVQPSKKFFGREGMELCWNPIQVLHAPRNLRVEVLQRLAEAEFVEKASPKSIACLGL